MNKAVISAPDTVTFRCSQCGECCTQVTMPIEQAKAEALLQKPWVQERLALFGATLPPLSEHYLRLPLAPDGACVFLADDKRCLIEAHEGLALKPDECRRFPFAPVEHEGQTRYDVSAACKTVAETLLTTGLPIVPASPEAVPGRPDAMPRRIPVGLRGGLDGAGYAAYLDDVAALCRLPGLSPEAVLRAAYQGLYRRVHGRMPRLSLSRPWLGERAVLFLFLRRPYGGYSLWQQLRGTYRDARVFGPQAVPLKTAAAMPWPEALNPLLTAFVRNVLRRQILLTFGHTLKGMLALAWVAVVLVRWHARVLAAIQGKPVPDVADTALAIRLVERYYTGHQPRFPEIFRTRPGLPWLLLKLGLAV